MRPSRCAAAQQRSRSTSGSSSGSSSGSGSGSGSSRSGSAAAAAATAATLPASLLFLLAAVFAVVAASSQVGAAGVDGVASLAWSNMTSAQAHQRHAKGRHHRVLAPALALPEPVVGPEVGAGGGGQDPSLLVWESRPMQSHLPLRVHPANSSRLTLRELRQALREERLHHNSSTSSCCPSVFEMIEPNAGKNQDGAFVELYRDGRYKQRFYELSCHRDVLNKPCRFVDKRLSARTRCVQQHGWTYALVRDSPGPGGEQRRHRHFPSFPAGGATGDTYTLDYISVRSGCSCVVLAAPPQTAKKRKKSKG